MDRQCLVCHRPFQWPGRGRPPETCSQECHRLRKNTQREETRQRAVARGCPANMHGTSSGYTHYKCTCVKCRLWARTYKQGRRRAQKEEVNG
jgi:hypothetical protein